MSSYTQPIRRTGSRLLNAIRHSGPIPRPFTTTAHTLQNQNQNQTQAQNETEQKEVTRAFAEKRNAVAPDTDIDDRTRINTERNEHSQSGTDSAVAAQASSWDINFHNPEDVREASYREAQTTEKKVCPLEVSPANQDVSRFTDESGRGESVVHGPSKRVSPKKGRRVDYGGQVVDEGNRG